MEVMLARAAGLRRAVEAAEALKLDATVEDWASGLAALTDSLRSFYTACTEVGPLHSSRTRQTHTVGWTEQQLALAYTPALALPASCCQ